MSTKKDFRYELTLSVIVNIITTIVFFSFGIALNFILNLQIPTPYLIVGILAISGLLSVVVISRAYKGISTRISYLAFLREDSATRSFDLLLEILKQFITSNSDLEEQKVVEGLLSTLRELIEQRRQPMQILEIDFTKIIEKAKQFQSQISITEQLLYYMDFMAAYKRMSIPRIIRQVNLYTESFGRDGITDYVITYGHSTIVVSSLISAYRKKPFPIIIVEDLQYHKESLGEHRIVCDKFKKANIPFYLIKFRDINKLFETDTAILSCIGGEGDLPLLRKRRIHCFIGCERIDLEGNTLVPSEKGGVPSETAQFLQELEAYAQTKGSDKETPARVIVLAESYKIRDFDKILDVQTHVPLKANFIPAMLYALGWKKNFPQQYPVSLFAIDSSNIYVHINELGIFPNINGKFDLGYCASVFENETSLLGFFSRPQFLKYSVFDEMRAVLFDLNGVLVDDESLHYSAYSFVLSRYGINLSLEDYNEYCHGKSDQDGFKLLKGKYSSLGEDVEVLVDQKHTAYLAAVETSNLLPAPGALKLLRELKNRGYKTALVTASNRKEAQMLLRYLNIIEYFHIILTNDEVPQSKPSPRPYLLAAEKLRIPPSRCIVLEDATANIIAVTEAGMKAIAIQKATHPQLQVNFVINSLEDLLVT